jgi:hypothetical protein
MLGICIVSNTRADKSERLREQADWADVPKQGVHPDGGADTYRDMSAERPILETCILQPQADADRILRDANAASVVHEVAFTGGESLPHLIAFAMRPSRPLLDRRRCREREQCWRERSLTREACADTMSSERPRGVDRRHRARTAEYLGRRRRNGENRPYEEAAGAAARPGARESSRRGSFWDQMYDEPMEPEAEST